MVGQSRVPGGSGLARKSLPQDIDLGLVDFPSERAGETVYLCWRAGETRIHSWHPVNQGFAGRKPLPDLPGV